MEILVTQYMRPTGHPVLHKFIILDKYAAQYALLTSCGCHINCEQLQTGEAVTYIRHEYGDFDIVITPCGPEADKGLLKMIDSFKESEFNAWLEEAECSG